MKKLNRNKAVDFATKALRRESCPNTSCFYDVHKLKVNSGEIHGNTVLLRLEGGHRYMLEINPNSEAYEGLT